jgi:hypothetical protein
METSTLLDTRPVYSNEKVFNLIENFLLGRQQQRIARMTENFHPEIEFRGIDPKVPTIGMNSLTERMQLLLKETNNFNFKLKEVTWDENLSTAAAMIEYEYRDASLNKGFRMWEIAMIRIENGLIRHYISAKEELSSWQY